MHGPATATATATAAATPTVLVGPGLKCPELLLRGVELQGRARVELLEKKGKRFESPWHAYYVAVFAHVLFYYENLREHPRGVVPLAGASVKAVDRIFKQQQQHQTADGGTSTSTSTSEDCGPCFKITSSASRVLLFRCESVAARDAWIERLQQSAAAAAGRAPQLRAGSSIGSSNDREQRVLTDAAAAPSPTPPPMPSVSVQPEISQMLRDAMGLVQRQKDEIVELKRQLQEARDDAAAASLLLDTFTSIPPMPAITPIGPTTVVAATAAVAPSVAVEEMEEEEDSGDDDDDVVSPQDATNGSGPASEGQSSSTEYLQRQAMELAEIARTLQMTFQNEPSSTIKHINSANSSTPTEMMDHVSVTGSNYSTSGMSESGDRSDVDDDSGSERLSDFEEADAKFLESSGLLDSIQKAMEGFTSPTQSPKSGVIINDDVIAEIQFGMRPGNAHDGLTELFDPSSLRALRSQSSCDDTSDYKLDRPYPTGLRTQSARITSSDFGAPQRIKSFRSAAEEFGAMVAEDNMVVVSSILQTASRQDKSSLLLPLLRLFGTHGRLSRLIRWAIEIEVASVMNVATLFRSDDYASRLVSTYSKAVGSGFIKYILSEPIQELYKLKLDEVDISPDMRENDEIACRNAENLMSSCQLVLDSILSNQDKIPLSYYHICSHLNAKVIRRFDGSMEGVATEDPDTLTRSVIGGFLFLRFVCPAITTPHMHELTDEEPTSETRRVLVLVTKLLFKTATSVLFGDREPHFRILNTFIERNSPAIHKLFVDLSTAPAIDIDESFASDSQQLFSDVPVEQQEQDLATIRAVAEKNLGEIENKLSVSGCSPQLTEMFRTSLVATSKKNDSFLSQRGIKTKKLNMKFLSGLGKIVRKQAEV